MLQRQMKIKIANGAKKAATVPFSERLRLLRATVGDVSAG